MAVNTFRLPDPGEGLVEAEIVSWRVAVGDEVKINDILLEVETSKSVVELPTPFAGTVTALLVNEGDTVDVGTPIVSIDDGIAAGSAAGDGRPPPQVMMGSQPPPRVTIGPPGKPAMIRSRRSPLRRERRACPTSSATGHEPLRPNAVRASRSARTAAEPRSMINWPTRSAPEPRCRAGQTTASLWHTRWRRPAAPRR